MILTIYALKDKKADVFFNFHASYHTDELRNLCNALRDDTSMLRRYDDDFSLWCLGSFDDSTGKVISNNKPRLVVNCSELDITSQSDLDSLIEAESQKSESVSS